jgi:glycine/D-amino acid oxidase-like deaminating enzyme
MRKISVAVVGSGPVGTAIALALQGKQFAVTMIAERLPGEGLTGDLAAGIGCVFKSSSQRVASLVLDSYPTWMELASDPDCSAVAETRLLTVTESTDPPWASRVSNFARLDDRRAAYLTYAFDPLELGKWRLDQFQHHQGTIEHRPLSADEVQLLRGGASLPGFAYTVVTIGLALRAMRPELGLYPVRGLLVHFPPAAETHSFTDEDACSCAISRPNGLVIGATFDRHVETCSNDEQLSIGERIVADANTRFGLTLNFDTRTRITVGYRPAVGGDLVLELGERVAWVNGLGGQGWVTGPALSQLVATHVKEGIA